MADKFDQLVIKASDGDAEAQYELANIYYDVFDKHFSPELAAKWYLKSAEQGNADAQFCIARLYSWGDGIEASTEEALKWYKAAVKQGHSDAMCDLAGMYLYDPDVRKSKKQAIKLYEDAAGMGNSNAQYFLGLVYLDGEYVDQSFEKARMWFMRQMKKDTATKQQCLEASVAALPELYPDTLRFELDFRKERERLIDSKRFNDACKALNLDPVNVADNVVFEGKGTLEKVLKEGLQVLGERVHMFQAPLWVDTQSLYPTEQQQKEEGADE